MRLILAALIAAILGFGGALLFSNYFESIAIDPPIGEDMPRTERDSPTRVSSPKLEKYNLTDLHIGCSIGWHPPEGLPKGANFNRQVALVRSAPTIPLGAREDQRPHYVDAWYSVEANGAVSDIEIRRAEPSNLWNRSVTMALLKWEFKAAAIDGEKIKVHNCVYQFASEQPARG